MSGKSWSRHYHLIADCPPGYVRRWRCRPSIKRPCMCYKFVRDIASWAEAKVSTASSAGSSYRGAHSILVARRPKQFVSINENILRLPRHASAVLCSAFVQSVRSADYRWSSVKYCPKNVALNKIVKARGGPLIARGHFLYLLRCYSGTDRNTHHLILREKTKLRLNQCKIEHESVFK